MRSEFRCPHCGHKQVESTRLISTFCRACGRHYSVGNGPSRCVTEKKTPIASQVLICHRCGQHQRVSVHAQVTLCPQCNTSISLTDVVIAQSSFQEIDTRGQLTILPTAHLEARFSICGSALIKGKFSGILVCEQTARLFGEGRCRAQLIAKRIVVEPEADLCFHLPLCTEELVVYGKLAATIRCSGIVRIHKRGSLEGPVRARGMEVSKYGTYTGDLYIHRDEPKEMLPTPLGEFPQLKANMQRRISSGESLI